MAGNEGRRYVLISGDAHAGADLLGYKPYLEKDLHDEFDAWAGAFQEDTWARIDDEVRSETDENVTLGVSSFSSPYNWDSDARIEHMDREGIAGEVIFPNTVPPFYPRSIINAAGPTNAEEYRLRWAGVKAHNRWLADFCAQAPERRAGLAQIFLYDLDDAIAEVYAARDSGLKGLLVPADHSMKLENLYERRLDPFWAACVDAGLAVNRHSVFTGPPSTPEIGPAAEAIGLYEITTFFRRGLAHLILGGVIERFPELKFTFTETGTSWVAEELMTMEYMVNMARTKGSPLYPMMRGAVSELTKTPREYFDQSVWIGASIASRRDFALREVIGSDNLIWGSDYPHHEGSYPHTHVALRWNLWDVPEAELRKITSENAAEVFGFDLDKLQVLADRIGPTPEEVAVQPAADELPAHSMNAAIMEAHATLDHAAA
jgi:predicted TIM-barrel fold metal-dependent hydrolase